MFNFLHLAWLVVVFNGNPVTLHWQSADDFTMRAGYVDGRVIRVVPFAASDRSVAQTLDRYQRLISDTDDPVKPVDYAPAMQCALETDAVADAYILNCGALLVFGTEPGRANYTPFWRAHWLEWTGRQMVPVKTEAQILMAIGSGLLRQTKPDFVLDATIVQNSSRAIIKQALEFEILNGEAEVELPAFATWYTARCCEPNTGQAQLLWMLITDSSDLDLANTVGANYAPRIADLEDIDCCNDVFAFVNSCPSGNCLPPATAPIVSETKWYRYFDNLQANPEYNPAKCWTLVAWDDSIEFPGVLKNFDRVQPLIDNCIINVVDDGPLVTNSPIFFHDEEPE